MKNILIILIISIFSITSLNAEVANNLIINGNKRVSDETEIYGEIIIGKNYSDKDLDDILKNLYSTNFFENVSVNLINNTLTVTLKEYPIINQLIILGEKSNNYKDQIKKIIKLKEKRSFIKSYLAKDIELIKDLYASAGYNFSSVNAKVREVDSDNLDLVIEVDRGKQTKISSIKFIGNNSIRSGRLRDIIASEEDKFWKIISRNTNFSENLINLDKDFYQIIINFGFYDVNDSNSTN